jgi:hypothetical protein
MVGPGVVKTASCSTRLARCSSLAASGVAKYECAQSCSGAGLVSSTVPSSAVPSSVSGSACGVRGSGKGVRESRLRAGLGREVWARTSE